MLYEISLKYNTLKMYENTLEQMRKNGVNQFGITNWFIFLEVKRQQKDNFHLSKTQESQT